MNGIDGMILNNTSNPNFECSALTIFQKIFLNLKKFTLTSRQIYDLFHQVIKICVNFKVIFPLSEKYIAHFPEQVSIVSIFIDGISKTYLNYLEFLKNTEELPYIWLTLLKSILKLIENGQKAQNLEFIEITTENLKNLIKVMLNLKMMGKFILLLIIIY